jgi:hypothetical protein
MLKLSNIAAAVAALLSASILATPAAVAQQSPGFPQPDASRTVCTQQYDPVCARRGNRLRTFGNACEAQRAGYRIEFSGECGFVGPGPGRYDPPLYCTREYAPVCAAGREGRRTFSNACEADVAGYRIIHPGRC